MPTQREPLRGDDGDLPAGGQDLVGQLVLDQRGILILVDSDDDHGAESGLGGGVLHAYSNPGTVMTTPTSLPGTPGGPPYSHADHAVNADGSPASAPSLNPDDLDHGPSIPVLPIEPRVTRWFPVTPSRPRWPSHRPTRPQRIIPGLRSGRRLRNALADKKIEPKKSTPLYFKRHLNRFNSRVPGSVMSVPVARGTWSCAALFTGFPNLGNAAASRAQGDYRPAGTSTTGVGAPPG